MSKSFFLDRLKAQAWKMVKNNGNYSTMWKCSNFSLEILYLIDFEKFFNFISMWTMECEYPICYLFEYQLKYLKSNLMRPCFVLQLFTIKMFTMENFSNIKCRMDFNFETSDSSRYYEFHRSDRAIARVVGMSVNCKYFANLFKRNTIYLLFYFAFILLIKFLLFFRENSSTHKF